MATVANVKGKVIALTGAASGIGLATARVLASRGAHLSLADVQEKQLLSAAEEIRSQNPDVKVTTTVLDVRSEDQVNGWITKTVQELGSLDGAANVAGTAGKPGAMGQIKDFQTENWEFIMGINCTGVFYCMRAQLQNMKEGAAIVNVASVAGLASARGLCAYGASKAAVISLTKTAARENGERNIRVNAIAPGVIDTPMVSDAEKILGHKLPTHIQCLNRKADPVEVGRLIAFLLSDDASFITGSIYTVDAGFTA